MPRLLLFILVVTTGLSLQCREPFHPFVLADRQNPCTIVFAVDTPSGHPPAAADESVTASSPERSALELRHYLARLLGLDESAFTIQDDSQPAKGKIILLGRPGVKSSYSAVARNLANKYRKMPVTRHDVIRFDAWNDEERQILTITSARKENLLRAVYAFLEQQGAGFVYPGKGGEIIETRQEIRVEQAEIIIDPGIPYCGFFMGCGERSSAPPDSAWLIWWARQRITHVPLQWARDRQTLHRWDMQEMVADELKNWRPGYCVTDKTAYTALVQELFSHALDPGIHLLDAGKAAPLCDCARCQALGSAADRWLHLIQRIGTEMAEMKTKGNLHPDVRLLAIRMPELPERFDGKNWPKEQILLGTRMLPRCYNHAIDDPYCLEVNSQSISGLLKWMIGHSFADLAVVEGYYAPEFAGLPLVLDKVITRDLAFYQSLGIQGLFCEAPSPIMPGVQSYQNYLFTQALRHQHLNVDSLRQVFVTLAYPGAVPMILEYLKMLEEAFANVSSWRWEMAEQVRQLEKDDFNGPLLPLARFRNHFTLYQKFSETDEGVAWERTFQLVHDARHVMDSMLEKELPDPTLERLLQAEMQLRFAELMVTFYDNMIRSLTLGEDEPAMREEAAIRLRQVVKKMAEFRVADWGCGTGTALSYSGLEESARALLVKLQQRYGLPYERVYEE